MTPSGTVYVVVHGALPGAKMEELPALVLAAMARSKYPGWHFEVAAPGTKPANRIEWQLEPGPDAGGTIRSYGFTRAMMARLFGTNVVVAVQGSLYMDNVYQTMVSGQVRDLGNPRDEDIAAEFAELTREIVTALPFTARNGKSPVEL